MTTSISSEFISNLARRCQSFSRLMKKGILFEWDKACSNAFNSIKAYLIKPSVLVVLVRGYPLVLYIATQERSIKALLTQKNDNGKKNALYYFSKMMTPNELKYFPIENICLALVFAIQKLKHYFQAHTVHLVSKDVLVVEVTLPWKMYFDEASHREGAGTQVVFVTSNTEVLSYSFSLTQNCSNNIAKIYEVKKHELLPHFNYAKRLIRWLGDVGIEHIPKVGNKQADALAKLTSTLAMAEKVARIPICRNWVVPPIFGNENYKEEENHIVKVLNSRKKTGPFHRTIVSWPFETWGLDMIGPIIKSSVGHLHILATTDYFSKWAKAIPLKEVKKENVSEFIHLNIIYHYGIPQYIITDNGKPPYNNGIDKLCQRFSFNQRKSSTRYVVANGLPKAFNKTLCNLLKKIEGLTEEKNACLRLEELQSLDEKRLEAQQSLECYQARLPRAFHKKVYSHSFQVGDLMLAIKRKGHKEVYTNGAYKLIIEDGSRVGLMNGKFLKRYYA
ncbi:hypothetical protein CDL12_01972 [Handroanthus impetiginosus]|uniref:Integrase catalytic domain-containing protein n=1 Tax=Handroanthus impetiginosus TaxID=429701 RepID=A0A2G9I6M5_9LAMI|nr:hypothetical protein CDL12_01972 [Handroanthus impetiginosus]